MCGNFDGDMDNEFQDPDGVDITLKEFGPTYCLGESCAENFKVVQDPCVVQTRVSDKAVNARSEVNLAFSSLEY